MSKPNVVFVFCDQFRFDCIGGFGHPDVKTPHLDALLSEGVGFDNVVTQCPLCVPARASLFTGQYVHQHGCSDNSWGLWPQSDNFVREIASQGFDTVQRGKLHLFWRHDNELLMSRPLLEKFGFTDAIETTGKCSEGRLRASAYTEFLNGRGKLIDFWKDLLDKINDRMTTTSWGPSILDEDEHIDTWLLDQGVACLKQYQDASNPIFLWVGPPGPHDPYDPAGRWAKMYDPSKLDVGLRRDSQDERTLAMSRIRGDKLRDQSDQTIGQLRAMYYGNISAIDDGVGKLVAQLKSQGEYDNTWFVFGADHGEMLGDFHCTGKTVFHKQSDQVPLIIKPPASVTGCPRGTVSHALVELIDITATLNAIAGGQLAGNMGRSLLPILTGETDPQQFREVCFSQFKEHAMFRTAIRKLSYTFENPYDVDQQPVFNTLYHLDDDPDETCNVLDANPDEAMALYEQYARPFYQQTKPQQLPDRWKDQAPFASWGCHPHMDTLREQMGLN